MGMFKRVAHGSASRQPHINVEFNKVLCTAVEHSRLCLWSFYVNLTHGVKWENLRQRVVYEFPENVAMNC